MHDSIHYNQQSNTTPDVSLLAQLMRFLPMPYLYVNTAGNILSANTHLTEATGFALVEILQSSVDDLFVASIADRLPVLIDRADVQSQGYLIGMNHKQGHTISTRIKTMEDLTQENITQGFHILVNQIQEAYEVDAHLMQLEEYCHDLEQALQSQTAFIRDCLNELKNPVSTLTTSLYLHNKVAEKQKANAQSNVGADTADIEKTMQRYINQMETQVDHLKKRIHDAEVYLHTKSIHNVIYGNVVSLNEIVKEASDIFQESLAARGIKFQLKKPLRDCLIMGDRRRLLRAFMNIFANASQYTQDGCIRVTVKADYDTSLIFVLIQDTGIGIPEAEQPYIFERFYRAENAKQYAPNRSGLGLCISNHIIKQHNGEIAVYSRENTGTSVVVTLPRVL